MDLSFSEGDRAFAFQHAFGGSDHHTAALCLAACPRSGAVSPWHGPTVFVPALKAPA
jgi:hypothetical protein